MPAAKTAPAKTKKPAPAPVKAPAKAKAPPAKRRKPAAPKKPPGRPSTFKQAIADEICKRLSKGEPLAAICRDEHMPGLRTVSDWRAVNADFSAAIAGAREDGFDQIAADCLDIADETTNDTIYGESGAHANTEWISRSKLRIETRLKLLAKWDPKRYGDKMQHTGDGGGPIETHSLTDTELEAKIALLQGRAGK